MIRASGGLLGARKLTSGLHEKWGISLLEENLPNFEVRSHNVGVVVVVVAVAVAAASVVWWLWLTRVTYCCYRSTATTYQNWLPSL